MERLIGVAGNLNSIACEKAFSQNSENQTSSNDLAKNLLKTYFLTQVKHLDHEKKGFCWTSYYAQEIQLLYDCPSELKSAYKENKQQ